MCSLPDRDIAHQHISIRKPTLPVPFNAVPMKPVIGVQRREGRHATRNVQKHEDRAEDDVFHSVFVGSREGVIGPVRRVNARCWHNDASHGELAFTVIWMICSLEGSQKSD